MKRYYGIVIYPCMALISICFFERWSITPLSALPLFLMVLMYVQGGMLRGSSSNREERTSYGGQLEPEEEQQLFSWQSTGLYVFAPWMLPFVFFFSSGFKLCAVGVYLLGWLGGILLFRVRYRKEIASRIQRQKDELHKQERREKDGKY